MSISERLRGLRGTLPRNAWAETLGIHPQTIYEYEKGKKTPTPKQLARISEKLKISYLWLSEGIGSPTGENTSDMSDVEKKQRAEKVDQKNTSPSDCRTENNTDSSGLIESLRRDLELEREERRQLNAEVRDLTAENRKLWQDNATLREKCARLEERSHRFEHRKSHDDIPSAG